MDLRDIQQGWDVYGSDGNKIGDVASVGSNYVHITKGLLFPKDIYVPDDAISRVESNAVYLTVSRDQVDKMGWNEPPAGGEHMTPQVAEHPMEQPRGSYAEQSQAKGYAEPTSMESYETRPGQEREVMIPLSPEERRTHESIGEPQEGRSAGSVREEERTIEELPHSGEAEAERRPEQPA